MQQIYIGEGVGQGLLQRWGVRVGQWVIINKALEIFSLIVVTEQSDED